MHEAIVNEFPFVAELPKREKSKLAKLWDQLAEVRAITNEKGLILPQSFVSKLLDVSDQRISQLLDDGKLDGVCINGRRFVTEKSVIEWAGQEHKTGRPTKAHQVAEEGNLATAKHCFKAAKDWVAENRATKPKK